MGGGGVRERGVLATVEDTRSSWSSSRFLLYIGWRWYFALEYAYGEVFRPSRDGLPACRTSGRSFSSCCLSLYHSIIPSIYNCSVYVVVSVHSNAHTAT
jgi:hypothetical protein